MTDSGDHLLGTHHVGNCRHDRAEDIEKDGSDIDKTGFPFQLCVGEKDRDGPRIAVDRVGVGLKYSVFQRDPAFVFQISAQFLCVGGFQGTVAVDDLTVLVSQDNFGIHMKSEILEDPVEDRGVDVDLDHIQRFPGGNIHDHADQRDDLIIGADIVGSMGTDEDTPAVGPKGLLIPALSRIIIGTVQSFPVRAHDRVVQALVIVADKDSVYVFSGVTYKAHVGIQTVVQLDLVEDIIGGSFGKSHEVIVESVVVVGLHGNLLGFIQIGGDIAGHGADGRIQQKSDVPAVLGSEYAGDNGCYEKKGPQSTDEEVLHKLKRERLSGNHDNPPQAIGKNI